MPRLFFVRHAPTSETGTVLTGRTPGVGLDDRGREIARETAAQFRNARVATLVTSPVQRCRETARDIGRELSMKPSTDRAFEEVDYGDWSGRRLKDLYRLKAWRHLHSAPSRVRFPNGETLAETQARAIAGTERLVARHRAKDQIVVVSHADVIKSVVLHYLGAPLDLLQRLAISAGSTSVVDLPTAGPPTVLAVNLRAGVAEWLP